MDEKVNDYSDCSFCIVFVFFGGLAFVIMHAFTRHGLLADVFVGSCAGICAVLSLYILKLCLKKSKEWVARVFRAIAIGLLFHGLVTIPYLSLCDRFGGWRRIRFTGTLEAIVHSDDAPSMMMSGIIGGVFAVASLALWKSRLTAIIVVIAVVFVFPYLLGMIPLFYR